MNYRVTIDTFGITHSAHELRLKRGVELRIEGWIADIDERMVPLATFGTIDGSIDIVGQPWKRPDVVTAFGSEVFRDSGFRMAVSTNELNAGSHEFSLSFKDTSGNVYDRVFSTQFEIFEESAC